MTARVRLVASPTGSPRILMLSNGGTTVGNLTLSTARRLRLRNGSTAVGAESTPLQIGSTYLIGLRQTRGTGGNAVLRAYIAPDGTTFGAPFASLTTGTWTTSADRIRLGATNGTAVDLTMDDVLIASGGVPAPVEAAGGAIVLAAAVPGSAYAYARVATWTGGVSVGEPVFTFSCPVSRVA